MSLESSLKRYKVKESLMVDHGCCEVRAIKAGTEVEVVKIIRDMYCCETSDGLSFYISKEKLEEIN